MSNRNTQGAALTKILQSINRRRHFFPQRLHSIGRKNGGGGGGAVFQIVLERSFGIREAEMDTNCALD